MLRLHPYAPTPAHSPCPHQNPLADQLECDRTLLRQRAIDGLTEALHVLRGNPKSIIELQHALRRSMRGVTALKRLAALGGSSEPTQVNEEVPAVQTNILTKKRRRRRYFDAHYKWQVVQLIREQHLTVGQVCKHLNLVDSAVRRWILEFGAQKTDMPHSPCGTDNTGSQTAHQLSDAEQRIRQLEERLQQLQSDNDLLKKASASFAREIHGLCAA